MLLGAVLALGAAAPASATVPGADGSIAFDSERDGNPEIYTMNPDGTGQTRRTTNPASDQNPVWSPEGTRIAFHSLRDGNSEVYVMNADGTGQTRLTTNPATDANPTWSPNGDQIAFQTSRDGNNEIYRMNADGSNQTRLTTNLASDFRPSWSASGTKIAFGSQRDGNNEIYSMNPDGTGQTRLTVNPAPEQHPAWLASSAQLAFVRASEIVRMNADGSGQALLTTTANNTGPAGSAGDGIVFTSSRNGNPEVYAMKADGTGQTRLTDNPAVDANPDSQARNRAPECQNALERTPVNTPITVTISCTDPDGNPLGYVIGTPGDGLVTGFNQLPQAGGLSPFLQPPGAARFTYTPKEKFAGNETIAFTATDQRGGVSSLALLTIQVLAPAPPPRQSIPDVRSFGFSPKAISVDKGSTPVSAAAKGGAFTYDVSADGRVQIEIEKQTKGRSSRGRCKASARRGRRCTLFQFKGTLNRNASAGANRTPFTGRIGSKALAKGTYLATITPFAANGEPGVPRTTTFKVVGGKKKKK